MGLRLPLGSLGVHLCSAALWANGLSSSTRPEESRAQRAPKLSRPRQLSGDYTVPPWDQRARWVILTEKRCAEKLFENQGVKTWLISFSPSDWSNCRIRLLVTFGQFSDSFLTMSMFVFFSNIKKASAQLASPQRNKTYMLNWLQRRSGGWCSSASRIPFGSFRLHPTRNYNVCPTCARLTWKRLSQISCDSIYGCHMMRSLSRSAMLAQSYRKVQLENCSPRALCIIQVHSIESLTHSPKLKHRGHVLDCHERITRSMRAVALRLPSDGTHWASRPTGMGIDFGKLCNACSRLEVNIARKYSTLLLQ